MNPYVMFSPQDRKVAYFSMEVGLRPEIPTYSGGLGILAGDTLKSFADPGVPAAGVKLLYTKGYFRGQLGYCNLEAMDYSPDMIGEAEKKDVYLLKSEDVSC